MDKKMNVAEISTYFVQHPEVFRPMKAQEFLAWSWKHGDASVRRMIVRNAAAGFLSHAFGRDGGAGKSKNDVK